MDPIEDTAQRFFPSGRIVPPKALGIAEATLLALGAVLAFQIAFRYSGLSWLVLGYVTCLLALRRVSTARQAFYFGLLVGLGVFVPQMQFLWQIFGVAAVPLWLILALFHAVFLLLLQRVEFRWGTSSAVVLAPVVWCGIEYLRSEVWWLKFSWFTAASPLVNEISAPTRALLGVFGLYGSGFVLFAVMAQLLWRGQGRSISQWMRWTAVIILVVGFILIAPRLRRVSDTHIANEIKVAGVQLEFPGAPEVLIALNRLVKEHPEAELIMLSEYSFDGPIPNIIRDWCRRNQKWLIAGGKEPIAEADPASAQSRGILRRFELGMSESKADSKERYFNTAFVVSTNGEVVFSQAKARPIQFFRDGEPATDQQVWQSPWGPLGILICYDSSYRRVTDELIRQGALALLLPAMDVEHWGAYQHWLNARVTRVRAAEHGVPIFRVASSGISQVIDPTGRELACAPYPGAGVSIFGPLKCPAKGGTRPLDTWLAPICLVGTVAIVGGLIWPSRRVRTTKPTESTAASTA